MDYQTGEKLIHKITRLKSKISSLTHANTSSKKLVLSQTERRSIGSLNEGWSIDVTGLIPPEDVLRFVRQKLNADLVDAEVAFASFCKKCAAWDVNEK